MDLHFASNGGRWILGSYFYAGYFSKGFAQLAYILLISISLIISLLFADNVEFFLVKFIPYAFLVTAGLFIWILSNLFRIKKEADGIKFKRSSGVKWLLIIAALFMVFMVFSVI